MKKVLIFFASNHQISFTYLNKSWANSKITKQNLDRYWHLTWIVREQMKIVYFVYKRLFFASD